MKTFSDLMWEEHPAKSADIGVGALLFPASFSDAKRATIHFDNGYGVSVVSGKAFYTSPAMPYEVAVLRGNNLCYDTDITDDTIGYQTADAVTEVMRLVQELSPREGK